MDKKARRKSIKSLVAVGGAAALPGTWYKPVVASVMLPAHATTTVELPSPLRLTQEGDSMIACLVPGCEMGNDPAQDFVRLFNTSASSVTVTGATSTNPSHTISVPFGSFPLVINGLSSSCGFMVTDTSALCGSEVNAGTISVHAVGFADLEVQVPTMD